MENTTLLHAVQDRIWFCGQFLDIQHDSAGAYVTLNDQRVSVVDGLAIFSELVAASRALPAQAEEKTA